MRRALLGVSGCVLLSAVAFAAPLQSPPGVAFSETEISFKAEDGWMIHGTLSIPSGLSREEKVPGVLMVHSPSHDQDIYLGAHQVGLTTYATENLRTAMGVIVALRIDIRGRGKSAQPQEYHSFTEEQRGQVTLDVAGAVDFLCHQGQVDSNRIGIVAEGPSADPAVRAAFVDHRVVAVGLLSGRLSEEAKKLVATRDIPVLSVASKEDKIGVADMADVYSLSRSSASDLMIYNDLGIGYPMFIVWANKFPREKSLESTVGEWFAGRLLAAGRSVSFKTQDGWTLFGTLRLPPCPSQGAPGVVLLHSYLTDRHIFDHLEELLADSGLAVLNFDFRGRGESKGKGTYFELSLEERDKAWLDARAALDFLASQKGVNPDRLALVTTSIGVKYGLKAAAPDARVKAFVMLGGMPDRTDVEKSRFPILFVSSKGSPPIMKAFQDFYRLARDRGSSLLEYEGGSIGYQLFELDESLQPFIVRWLKPQLNLP